MNEQYRDLSFASLLAGGALILVGGLGMSGMMGSGGIGWMGGMMGDVLSASWLTSMAWWMAGVSLVTGAIVLLSAYFVGRGQNTSTWGTVAIVAGAASLLAMGGWIVGAAASILGGALALTTPPRNAPERPA